MALIGAWKDDDQGDGSGSVYVFTRTSGTWDEETKIYPLDPSAATHFGCSVSLYADTALIGRPHDNTQGDDAGAVYVFTKVSSTSWMQRRNATRPRRLPMIISVCLSHFIKMRH